MMQLHEESIYMNVLVHIQHLGSTSARKTKKKKNPIFTPICYCVNIHQKPKLIILSLRSSQQLLGVFMQAELLAVIRTMRANTH